MAIEAVLKLCLCNPAGGTCSVMDTDQQFLESHFPTERRTNTYRGWIHYLKVNKTLKFILSVMIITRTNNQLSNYVHIKFKVTYY